MMMELLQSLSHIVYMALHVVNAGSFPRPLSAERERECLSAYREEGDIAARNELIEHNLRLVAHIIKKYYSAVRDQDDLISIGTIGLIKAVIAEDDHIVENLELKVNAERLHRYIVEVLEPREREIIEWRYGLVGDGLTQREVAKKLDISRSYVSRIEKKALEKLKRRFDAGDMVRKA